MIVTSRLFSVLLCLTITWTRATPTESTSSSTLRYIAGDDLNSIIQGMTYDDLSVFHLGSDGVLRTFANNLTVLDYHQLDVGQVQKLASEQAAQYQASGSEVPASLTQLAESPVDGRLTVDINALMNPDDKPNVTPITGTTPRSVDLENLFERQVVCPGVPGCMSLADCTPYNCFACFYPSGPPWGTCFLSGN
ncbi:uncharacterized protein LY89DRAFT_781058 [Mollisia scopiformis]|uniref:Uncharacterized protein n=1 Tax=Mollisia scopiformis TaxID=149040 RepID=A0A194XCQ1_MOLSC|nr:uncharacterized protein LY89DRAFT_781058 [Mollisia scopiformis]KUJ17931.1 hypothetical protein LY89DRAFT_781058 [Mollisia scopiformis]